MGGGRQEDQVVIGVVKRKKKIMGLKNSSRPNRVTLEPSHLPCHGARSRRFRSVKDPSEGLIFGGKKKK
jgi:hypothetical protein